MPDQNNDTTKNEPVDRGDFNPLVRAGIAKTPEEAESLRNTAHGAIDTTGRLIDSSASRFLRGAAGRHGKSSIIGMAAKNTFEFPVFVSKSVPLDYATATNSLLEQIYASYLQMAVSLNPVIDSKTAKSGGPFSNFKTNITKYVEYTDMFYAHDACYAVYQEDGVTFEFSMLSITDDEAQFINESVAYQPLSEFDHFFQESKSKRRKFTANQMEEKEKTNDSYDDEGNRTSSTKTKTPSEASVAKLNAELEEINQRTQNLAVQRTNLLKERERIQQQIDSDKDMAEDRKAELEKKLTNLDKQNDKLEADIDNAKLQYDMLGDEYDLEYIHKDGTVLDFNRSIIDKRIKLLYDAKLSAANLQKALDDIERSEERWKMEKEKHAKDMMVRGPQFLDESKIQKLNTMKPLMMQVQLKVVDKNGGISAPVEYIVGVKTHCRLIDPETLPEVVEYPLKKMDKITRKAKWRAGEIKFFDYLFNTKEKKQTAIDSKDPKRKWYRRLYELAHKKGDANVARRIAGGGDSGLIPNATIMMSQTDVDNIRSSTNINLLNGGSAKKFCNELFLMSLIVIDLDSESIKVLLPDINNDYEVHSLASVKKQLATLDTTGDKARDMFKLLGK